MCYVFIILLYYISYIGHQWCGDNVRCVPMERPPCVHDMSPQHANAGSTHWLREFRVCEVEAWIWGCIPEGTDWEETGVSFPRIYSHIIFPHSGNKDIKRMCREGREPEDGEGGRAWGCGTVIPAT